MVVLLTSLLQSPDPALRLTLGPPRSPAAAAPTIPQELQERQVDGPLPVGVLLHGDAVASGGEDLARADGDQLAALVLARHVIEDGSVVDEGVQLPRDRQSPQTGGRVG